MARRGDTLELAVLGLLHDSPLHGYELRKRLNLVLGWGRVLSYGSLYPALKRLSKAGWITEDLAATPGPVSRRQRITYRLTPAGLERFSLLMAESGPTAWEDDNFDVHFAFFARIDRENRLRILEGRRARLEERLARVRKALDGAAAGGAGGAVGSGRDSYARELQRHGLESVERELAWLSGLIDAERRGTTGHDPSPTT